jgi:hypothetical protein
MMTISKLASELRSENHKKESENTYKRLTDTLKKFNEDFKEVICDLIKCDVKYEPCFWYKSKNDGEYHIFPPETKLDLTMNGNSGGKCTANSILFTFNHNGEERKKRLFYCEKDGWYYIAVKGWHTNYTYYIKDYRKDLILYLDEYFEGEYK